ncbi:MAG: alpha/beta hydrolase [Pseudomonadota bacterium]
MFIPILKHIQITKKQIISYPDLYSFDEYVRYAESQIPEEIPIALIAESFSGPIAIALIARNKRNYISAVLSTTFSRPPLKPMIQSALKFPGLVRHSLQFKRLAINLFVLNGVTDQELKQNLKLLLDGLSLKTIMARLSCLNDCHVSDIISQVRVPTLILNATNDRLLGNKPTDIFDIPTATVRQVDGPHLLLQANPKECSQLINSHVAP